MYVATSLPSILNYRQDGIPTEGVLKRYALLYDNIIFHTEGTSMGPSTARWGKEKTVGDTVCRLFHLGGSMGVSRMLAKNRAFNNIFVDAREFTGDYSFFDDPLPKIIANIDSEVANRLNGQAHTELQRQCGGGVFYGYNVDDHRKLYGQMCYDLSINQLLHDKGVELMSCYAPTVGRLLSCEYTHQKIDCHEMFSTDLVIPKFDSLSWDQIIELRSDKYINAFRKVIFDITLDCNSSIDAALLSKAQTDLWSLASDVEPNISTSFIQGFLGNLPLPTILNPFGIASAASDIYQESERGERYGHVFFINGVREKCGKKAR